MRKAFLISLLSAWPTTAVAEADARCAAKPFTLNKPKPAASKPAATTTADTAKAKSVAPEPAPKTGQAKPKLIGDCKEPKKG